MKHKRNMISIRMESNKRDWYVILVYTYFYEMKHQRNMISIHQNHIPLDITRWRTVHPYGAIQDIIAVRYNYIKLL